jgi:anion-transporting  ArsA/GET3 family ATPase
MITDPERSGVGIVATAEEMAVNESADLAASLEEAGVALDDLYVNELFPDRFAATELDAIRAARERIDSPALDAAIAEAERARVQRIELERLGSILPGPPIHELPFLFAPGFGEEQLRSLAEVLTP